MNWELVASHLFVLLGVVVGGGITYVVQRMQLEESRKTDRESLLREKLEELYQVAIDIRDGYLFSWTQALLKLSGNEPPEPVAKKLERHRLGMLVNLYFPSLSGAFQRVEKAGLAYGEPLERAIMLSTVPQEERGEVADALTATYRALGAEIESFLTEASALSSFRQEEP